MKIFAAGIATETNTFSPLVTALEDFFIQRGADVLAGRVDYPSLDLSVVWGKQARARGDEFVFSLNAWAQPAGITLKSAYESLRDELLNELRAALPVDIVLLNLHGAMVAQGYESCEQDLIRRVRIIAGPQTVIGVELDLHCHLSEAMLNHADIVITFKEYPHIDINERAQELFDLAVATRLGRVHPTMALFDCRMLGLFPTTRQPLRRLVDEMKDAERNPGILSISFGHGFQFADIPYAGAKVLAVTDGDSLLAQRVAREFGMRIYAMRAQIGFHALSLPMEQALAKALSAAHWPVVVADQSDNTGAGAPGDATFVLRWLLEHGVESAATAILHDPEAVKIAKKAGIGATLPIRLGGKLGTSSGTPLDVEVTVLSIIEEYMHEFSQQSGPPTLFPAGDIVALRCGNDIDIVVGSKRCQCVAPSIFSDVGIDPWRKRLLVPKSMQHFQAGFAAIAKEVIYMTAPGAVPPDPRQICYSRLATDSLYPWIDDPLAAEHSGSQ